jgi:hypothetical protein
MCGGTPGLRSVHAGRDARQRCRLGFAAESTLADAGPTWTKRRSAFSIRFAPFHYRGEIAVAKPEPSILLGVTVIQLPPQVAFPAPHPGDKKFNWRPVLSACFLSSAISAQLQPFSGSNELV